MPGRTTTRIVLAITLFVLAGGCVGDDPADTTATRFDDATATSRVTADQIDTELVSAGETLATMTWDLAANAIEADLFGVGQLSVQMPDGTLPSAEAANQRLYELWSQVASDAPRSSDVAYDACSDEGFTISDTALAFESCTYLCCDGGNAWTDCIRSNYGWWCSCWCN